MRPPGAASPSAKSIQEYEIPLPVMAGRMKKFSEHTSIPEVMDSSTLNFNPNFKFSRFFSLFFWGGGIHLRVSASKPWSISSECKNFGAQHSLRAEILSLEKVH